MTKTFEIVHYLEGEKTNSVFYNADTLDMAVEQYQMVNFNFIIKCVHEFDESGIYIETHRFNITNDGYWKEINKIAGLMSSHKRNTHHRDSSIFYELFEFILFNQKFHGIIGVVLVISFICYAFSLPNVKDEIREIAQTSLAEELGESVAVIGSPTDEFIHEFTEQDKINMAEIYKSNEPITDDLKGWAYTFLIDNREYKVNIITENRATNDIYKVYFEDILIDTGTLRHPL